MDDILMDKDVDQRLRDIQRDYLDFLDDEEDQGKYSRLIKNMINEKGERLIVNINDLRRKKPERATSLLKCAFEEVLAFLKALKEYVYSIDYEYAKEHEHLLIGFEGSFGSKHVTPRSLNSRHVGSLMCVEGVVTKCSLIQPKVLRSVHYCEATQKVIERQYSDLTSIEGFPSSSVYPTKDEDGRPLETEYGLSLYEDHQVITVQEMPEKAPPGQLPRSVDIVCDHDMVDLCKPGDRVQIVGMFRSMPWKQGGFTSGQFRSIIIANNVQQMSKEDSTSISREDVAKCKQLARSHKNIFELLAKSIAPSIHGHTYIKRAILCLLLGGVEKHLPNGTRLRGDINVLLIGDPSVAKSQLLRYVLYTAPRAITTTGRGATGVGLTAAVSTDQETGGKRLEAGAMVLADRGVTCIDEFDKMSDLDRTAIHEVMEQGRVTIAKSGIHATLNARCSVLAAANPVYGKYDPYKTPMENIGMQDSILSRFDFIFVMLDTVQEDQDIKIADHVVRMHRYRNPLEQDGEVLPMGGGVDLPTTYNADFETDSPIYEKYDPLLHGATRKRTDKILSSDFMRKYIRFVKIMKPTLTEEASEIIAEEYARLRSEEHMDHATARTQPVTARTIETLIRVSGAHAKARMSRTISAVDANAAVELVQFAYFKEVLAKEKRSKRRRSDAQDDSEEDQDENVDQNNRPKRKKTTRSAAAETTTTDDPYAYLSDNDDDVDTAPVTVPPVPRSQPDITTTTPEQPAASTIADERFLLFKSSLQRMFADARAPSIPLARIKDNLNTEYATQPFSAAEIQAAIRKMDEDNQIMVADEIVFLI